MIPRAGRLAMVLAGVLILAGGCGRGNGLPRDLIAHLDAQGIAVHAEGFAAPYSSRAGYVYFAHDPALEREIVTRFDLREMDPQDPLFSHVSKRVAGKPVALWVIAGRPPKLKLHNGAQFECLYLLTTEEGRTYLFAEYAYG